MIRLMSHNVWNRDENSPEWAQKGNDCSAAVRVHGLVRVYRETMPDIIGCQEVSSLMADLLKETCAESGLDYALIWGRFTPILYRADKFELIDSHFQTYPEYIDGYDGFFNDVKSKAFNIGVFREKATGKVFVFGTTHLWWMSADPEKFSSSAAGYRKGSDEARELQIAMFEESLTRYQKKYNCPAVLVGDLNTNYRSKAIAHVLSKGFRHARNIAVEYAEESVGYHECFPWGFNTYYSDAPFEDAIDHILLRGEPEGAVKRFERYSPDYYFPISDHSPAYIDVEF